MKKAFSIVALTLLFTLAISPGHAFCQGPPDPATQSDGSRTGGTPMGGSGAPVGRGEIFLLALAALYAGKKTYSPKSENF